MKRNALFFHMDLNEFWNGNPQNFFIYADAYQEELEQIDYLQHKQAVYNLFAQRQALSECLSKHPQKLFPEEPFYQSQKIKQIASNSLQERIYKGLLNAKVTTKPKKEA